MTKFCLRDKFVITGVQLGMIIYTMDTMRNLLEYIHSDIHSDIEYSDIDECFNSDGKYTEVESCQEIIEDILKNKMVVHP